MADYDKFELPFCVKPYEIKAEKVEKVGFGVKIKCFLPIELFDVLKYLMFFNINGKKAYLSVSNNNEKNIDCTFILVNILSYEQTQDFCIKSMTKARIARWNDEEQN